MSRRGHSVLKATTRQLTPQRTNKNSFLAQFIDRIGQIGPE